MKINSNVKKIQMHLKQLMDEETHNRVLEPNRTYPLEVYSDRIPLFTKLHLNCAKNPLNIYMRINDEDDEDDDE